MIHLRKRNNFFHYLWVSTLLLTLHSAATSSPTLPIESWRVQQMNVWFDQAETLTRRVLTDVQKANHPEDLPNYAALQKGYSVNSVHQRDKKPFALAAAPCETVLKQLYWPTPKDFAQNSKASILAKINAQADTIKNKRAYCVAGAPHYFGYEDDKYRAQILGKFTGLKLSNGYFIASIETPIRTDRVQLIGVKPPKSASLRAQGQVLVGKLCNDASTVAVVRSNRAEDNLNPKGWVSCGNGTASRDTQIAQALLRAGLAEIDYETAAKDNAVDSDKKHEKGYAAALQEARSAKRGLWATVTHGSASSSPALEQTAAKSPCERYLPWTITQTVGYDGGRDKRHYEGTLCLDLPALAEPLNRGKTTPLKGMSHWDCCPSTRSDAINGTFTVDSNGKNVLRLTRRLLPPHAQQTYTGKVEILENGSLKIVGNWTAEGVHDGQLRTFSAEPWKP